MNEVMNPTTPAMREKITKNPVARLPNGKYIGKIRAGIDNTDAANNVQVSVMKQLVSHNKNRGVLLCVLFSENNLPLTYAEKKTILFVDVFF